MAFKFKKSFKVAPGVRLNVGKKRSSVSVGGKGITANLSKRGVKTTVSARGTGLSYSTDGGKVRQRKKPEVATSAIMEFISGLIGLMFIGWLIYSFLF